MAARATTVVGVFSDAGKAEEAVQALRDAGFRRDQINVIVRDTTKSRKRTTKGGESHAEEGAIAGALTGGVAGGVLGTVLALNPITLPGGLILLTTSVVAGLLGGAATGAAAGGLIGGLIGLGIPEEEARTYAKEIRAGRTVVTVRSSRPEDARAILSRYGATELQGDEFVAMCDTTATSAATAGTANVIPRATSIGSSATARTGTDSGETIELHEEELQPRKQAVKKGEVRVRKEVKTEHKTLEVPVTREEVVIERRPVNRRASSADLHDGQEIRIPVREEEVHVEKTPVVKEEVRVGKRRVQETKQVSGTVRKEEARVEREGDVKIENDTTATRRRS